MVSRFDLVPFHLPIFAMPQAMAAPPQSLAGVWCQSCGCHDVMALWNSSGFDSKATCWWIQYPGSPAQRFPHGERKMLSGCRLIPWMWGPYLFAINKYMPPCPGWTWCRHNLTLSFSCKSSPTAACLNITSHKPSTVEWPCIFWE